MGLRLLIACNYRRHKNVVQIFNHKYQETIIQIQQDARNKCIELSGQYYSLTDEDRYLIEKMLDLIL
jgi:hypothetical protein